MVYRAELWLDMGFTVLFLFMQIFLWRALIASGLAGDTTIEDMVSYVVLSRLIGIMAYSGAEWTIQERLSSGDICHDLARPVSFRLQMLLADLGNAAANLLLRGAPSLIVAVLAVGMKPPASLLHFAAFLLLAALGCAIAFMTSYLVGLIAFYVLRVDYLSMSVYSVMAFLSGQYAPLWFYPPWLRAIAEYSPFKHIYYTPIAAYLGKASPGEVVRSLVVTLLWVGVFAVAHALLWRKTVRRLVVQGG